MTIYIDTDYKCHAESGDSRRAFDVAFFNGKCAEFIEGYRYVPSNETWTRADGMSFTGEMICPWREYNGLEKAQYVFDISKLSENITALNEKITTIRISAEEALKKPTLSNLLSFADSVIESLKE